MEIISSVQNPLIKETKKLQQKKYRDLRGEFLAEGVRLVEEGLKADSLRGAFYEEGILNQARGQALLWQLEQMLKAGKLEYCQQVSSAVLQYMAQTQTPQGIVAVAAKRQVSLSSIVADKTVGLILIVDGVSDPGNLGTLIRTAWAAGAEAVVCLPGTVDCYNAKTIRSTMGAVFEVPLITGEDWPTVEQWCRQRDYQLVAGDLSADTAYFSCSYAKRVALIVGSEGQGLSAVKPTEVDLLIKIPLANEVESLNAAVAGSLLLYEVVRQRKQL